MTEKKTYCDHCGLELNEMIDFTDTDIELISVNINTDLCVKCHRELCKLIKEFCSERGVKG